MIKYNKVLLIFKDNISVTSVWFLVFFCYVNDIRKYFELTYFLCVRGEYVSVFVQVTQLQNSIVKTTARRAKNSRTGIWIGFFLQRCFRSIRKICYLRLNKRKEKLTTATSHVAKTKVNKRGAMKKISMGMLEQKKTKEVQKSCSIGILREKNR